MLNRRQFVTGLASALPLSSLALTGPKRLEGLRFDLDIDYLPVNFTGRSAVATTVNGSVPGPTLYWQEGDEVTIRVNNRLSEVSSIHWHGIILPTEMDGVPGMSFDGIAPGGHYEYRFRLNQAGTYW